MSSGNAKIGKPAPEFKATAVVDGQFKDIKLSDYKGKCYLTYTVYIISFIAQIFWITSKIAKDIILI